MEATKIQDLTDRRLAELNYIHNRSIDKTLKWIKGFCIFMIIMTLLAVFLYSMASTGSKF